MVNKKGKQRRYARTLLALLFSGNTVKMSRKIMAFIFQVTLFLIFFKREI
jgi:hypothetical protein